MSELRPAGTAGSVSTSHELATRAGADALRRGGNAIDAAIAAAAALCVVYPNNVALGSDLVALVREPSGRIHFVNATGRTARAQNLQRLRERHGSSIPPRSIDSVTVPGGVRGWARMAQLGARLGWSDLLGAAHDLAALGHPLASSVARSIVEQQEALSADDGCRDLFLPGGTALREGDELRQPSLARTFATLMAHGPDAFYRGPVADRWITTLRARGSMIDSEDVAAYAAELTDPIRTEALGVEVVTSPPNTPGFAILRTLSALEKEHVDDPLGAHADELARLFAEANAIRTSLLADPDTMSDPHGLVDAAPVPAAVVRSRPGTGDTVGLVCVSDDGWAVSLVQSVYFPFGAAILDPETGILFQNRGTSFSLDPQHPAAFAGGRRPPHTLTPALVLRNGDLEYAIATMGGQAQPQIHVQLMLRLLRGASAAEATAAPRWSIGPQTGGDTERTLTLEDDVTDPARACLMRAPFTVKHVPRHDELLGHSNVIRVLPTGYDAASDPRSDGSAMVVTL